MHANKDIKGLNGNEIKKVSGGEFQNGCFKGTFTCSKCGIQYEKLVPSGGSFSFDDVTCCPSCRENKV